MKKMMILAGLVAFIAVAACGGSSGKVLVKINGEEITEGDLKFLGEINPRVQQQIGNPAGQKRVLDNLVEQNLMYQEAVKEGINRDSKVKAKIDLYKRVIIAQSLIEAETEKAAKKYYDEHQDEFKKIKLSDIMVKFSTPDEIKRAKKGEKPSTEEDALKKANEIKARLDKGDNFAQVAGEVSDDAATKARGGDMGFVAKGDKRMESRGLGELSAKAFEMKVGETAGPIKTDKGYYLITVTQGAELVPFDEAKQEILFKVQNDTRQNLLAKLKKDAKIVYPEEEKKKAEAAKTGAAKPAPEVKPAEGVPSPEGAAEKAPAETGAKPQVEVQGAPQGMKAAIEAAMKKANEEAGKVEKKVEGKPAPGAPSPKKK